MASSVAPPKNTGGGGFVFEDDVCAWLLACMLAGEPIFDADLGPPIRIDFQTRVDGWYLDDALVTTAKGTTQHRFALSIKSNAQFTASTAPSDFVMGTWEQWLQVGSSAFQKAQDFMALVTAPLSAAAEASVSGLVTKARAADPVTFPARLSTPGWANQDERALFSSFACPATLSATLPVTDVDTARLLQRVRFLQHDFGGLGSKSLKEALRLCRTCVRGHSSEDAEVLWNAMRSLAGELRPVSGSLPLQALVDRLRPLLALVDYPDHVSDWSNLDARSNRDAGLVVDAIAGRVRIARVASVDAVEGEIANSELLALLGASGAGKSAIARALFERRRVTGERSFWLDARSLDCADFAAFEATLRLRYSLAELLGTATSGTPVLILDGLDRLYSSNAFRNATVLLRLARQEAPATRWRVVAPCQSQEWPRVLEELQRAGAVTGTWKQLPLESLTVSDLSPVTEAMPALARLLLQPKVSSLLTNLKLLDLVARRVDAGTEVDSTTWVGESSVADWFWSAEIDRGEERHTRGRFVRDLAQRQADELVASVPIDKFPIGDLTPLHSLAADQVCTQVPGDRIAFAHDLYGDWVRLRILLNHRDDLPAFLRDRRALPSWHRALRLLGIHLLEHAGGVESWRSVLASFGQDELGVIHDVLLEAPVFAVNARVLLDAVLPDLLANNGLLCRRLLTRFLAFATVPNPQMVAIALSVGVDANTARATYRWPHWPYWLDVLAFLHAHRTEVLSAAPCEVARVVEMWLGFTPKGAVLRAEAAELGVLLGQRALDTRNVYGGRDWQRERERFYACALAAASERPDDVVTIALTAAGRLSQPPTLPVEGSLAPTQRHNRRLYGRSRVMREPWPDGPQVAVDDAFRKVVLDSTAILDLYRVRQSAACEVVLATLIEEPSEEDTWRYDWTRRKDLEIVNRYEWLPALYTQGPFLRFLREDFTAGLELVARLVEFAAARESEHVLHERDRARGRAIAEGHTEAEVDEHLATLNFKDVVLLDGERKVVLAGDERLYGWSAGLGSPPNAIKAALMALEQYLYSLIDEGKDVVPAIDAVLARSRSVAFAGLLIDVGKKQTELFQSSLRPLLSAPELYSWDISKNIQPRMHLMIGAVDKGRAFIEAAKAFHDLPHRKVDLRRLAIELMLRSVEMREYFDQVRAHWASVDGSSTSLRVSNMRAQMTTSLDFSNYEIREDPQHGRVLVNVKALAREAEQADERRVMNDRMLVTTLPMRCRTILDERQKLSDEQLAELWVQWGRVRILADQEPELVDSDEHFIDGFAHAVLGGAVVFLVHEEWCGSDPDRLPELQEAIRAELRRAPDRRTFDSEDLSAWTSECFCAEAVAIMWARDPKNQEWRQAVAESVFSEGYAAQSALFARCTGYRASLGEDFSRLRRLALEWAYVRDRMDLLRRAPPEVLQLDEQGLDRVRCAFLEWAQNKVTQFVSGSSLGMPLDWRECDDSARFQGLDAARKRWSAHATMDFHVVRCAHEWLPVPSGAMDQREREEIVHFWRAALAVVSARPMANLSRRDHQFPQDDERWVLERISATVLQLRLDEQPELLWMPILELHSEAHDWPEVFACALHRHALLAEETPTLYVALVRLIVQQGFRDVEGKRRWPAHERVWDALVGVDAYSHNLWEPRHMVLVRDLQEVFTLWMERVRPNGRRLAGFATWLARPPASPLRLQALVWLLSLVRVDEEHEVHDVEEAEDAIAVLLNTVWIEEPGKLRGDHVAFDAFRGLLSWLGDRQNQFGLELLGRLGSLT